MSPQFQINMKWIKRSSEQTGERGCLSEPHLMVSVSTHGEPDELMRVALGFVCDQPI